jgi:hypothetical protein
MEVYAVFLAVLEGSTATGIDYGCFESRQMTTEEYLLANREMGSIPVALSLLCRYRQLLNTSIMFLQKILSHIALRLGLIVS